MATLRIQMNNRQITMIPTGNFISKNSIKSVFFLSDNAVVRLSYKLGDEDIFCDSRTVRGGVFEPEPCFLLPELWQTLLFTVDHRTSSTRQGTPANQVVAERLVSPYLSCPPDLAPRAESFKKWMYYLLDNCIKSAVICVHKNFFVTFRHGRYPVSVVFINETLDYILMRSEVDIVSNGPPIVRARNSEPITMAGFGNQESAYSFVSGIIYSNRSFYFNNGKKHCGPYILGTAPTARGNSCDGVWGSYGLLGMNLGCSTMPNQLHTVAISEAATFCPRNLICEAFRFEEEVMRILEEERILKVSPPPRKKALLVSDFTGSDIWYGSSAE
ncbi:unnamed protein product [Auanema sp. JU1783]|nr:unnamed protein product [Auanema sp. JU1783]